MMLRASIERNGAGRSVVADRNGRLIAGNKTAEAARDAGLPVRVVQTDGSELIIVQRTDLDLLDPRGKARELAFADNRVGEVNLDWSPDALKDAFSVGAFEGLDYLFRDDELNRIVGEALVVDMRQLDEMLSRANPSGSDSDSESEYPTRSNSGDPWAAHPDSTSSDSGAEFVEIRFGDIGGRIDLVVYEDLRQIVDGIRSRGVVMISDIFAEIVRLCRAGDNE
jgi:hypothetical protein